MLKGKGIVRKVFPLWKVESCSAEPIFNLIPNTELTVIEIGVRYGESTYFINKQFDVKKYFCVDPFINYEEYVGDGFNKKLKNRFFSNFIFFRTRVILSILIGKKIKFIREFSKEAVNKIPDGIADLIFIDGNHTYNYVLEDLENYWNKLKIGGLMTGHDYFMRNKRNNGDYEEDMVYEAVQKFAKDRNLDIIEIGKHLSFPMCFAIRKH